jgi:hypothetical protein
MHQGTVPTAPKKTPNKIIAENFDDSSFDSDSVQIKFTRIVRRHFKINTWQ